jgi:hypothetical protein
MKRVVGGFLMLAGTFCLYQFVAGGMYHAKDLFGPAPDNSLPFASLGKNYPADALYLASAFWCLLLGICMVLLGDSARPAAAPAGSGAAARYVAQGPSKGGKVARLMFLNSLLLATSLFVAYIGAKAKQDTMIIAVFGVAAALQALLGLVLLLMALTERPKGPISLVLGLLVWLGGVGVGVLAFLKGGS